MKSKIIFTVGIEVELAEGIDREAAQVQAERISDAIKTSVSIGGIGTRTKMEVNKAITVEYTEAELAKSNEVYEHNDALNEKFREELDRRTGLPNGGRGIESFLNHGLYSGDVKADEATVMAMLDGPYIEGPCQFFLPHHWGEADNPTTGKILESPTVAEIMVEFDKLIGISGDEHHVFLEQCEVTAEINGIKQIDIHTGS